FVVEVRPEREADFLGICSGYGVQPILLGVVRRTPHVLVTLGDEPILHVSLADAASAYQSALAEILS
ncbi:MAG: hypothetical protein H5T86_10710, partial [Armatimonadetes bacterium]|nr:hypothetical protein [Armatimonadota bacterium]